MRSMKTMRVVLFLWFGIGGCFLYIDLTYADPERTSGQVAACYTMVGVHLALVAVVISCSGRFWRMIWRVDGAHDSSEQRRNLRPIILLFLLIIGYVVSFFILRALSAQSRLRTQEAKLTATARYDPGVISIARATSATNSARSPTGS